MTYFLNASSNTSNMQVASTTVLLYTDRPIALLIPFKGSAREIDIIFHPNVENIQQRTSFCRKRGSFLTNDFKECRFL